MVDAMIREIAMQKTYLNGEPLDTIYFGGGTPSILEHAQLAQLIDAVHKHHAINHHPEITLEANPDDLSEEKLSVLHQLGVNRLSIGIQSFDDEVLRFLNRAHDAQEASALRGACKKSRFQQHIHRSDIFDSRHF
jgi:oxygen-independent coproporphyrinogen-3 oxidase